MLKKSYETEKAARTPHYFNKLEQSKCVSKFIYSQNKDKILSDAKKVMWQEKKRELLNILTN